MENSGLERDIAASKEQSSKCSFLFVCSNDTRFEVSK